MQLERIACGVVCRLRSIGWLVSWKRQRKIGDDTMRKYYAAINTAGFANTWDVVAFSSKTKRDQYVSDTAGHYDGRKYWLVVSIGASLI